MVIRLEKHQIGFYEFNAYNRKGIDEQLNIPMKELCAKLLDMPNEAASIARDLRLFLRMNNLFSVNARPRIALKKKSHLLPNT